MNRMRILLAASAALFILGDALASEKADAIPEYGRHNAVAWIAGWFWIHSGYRTRGDAGVPAPGAVFGALENIHPAEDYTGEIRTHPMSVINLAFGLCGILDADCLCEPRDLEFEVDYEPSHDVRVALEASRVSPRALVTKTWVIVRDGRVYVKYGHGGEETQVMKIKKCARASRSSRSINLSKDTRNLLLLETDRSGTTPS